MSLKKFNAVFGIEDKPEAEKARFVARINQTVFTLLYKNPYPNEKEQIFRDVSYELGVDPGPMISEANYMNYGYELRIPSLRTLTNDDFMETLKVLTLLREAVSGENVTFVDRNIAFALSAATTDLGVRYVGGMFYPSGAKELDEKLIEDNLRWLQTYPSVKERFSRALQHFQKSLTDEAARKDSITNAYSSIEDLAQKILNNNKNFDKNSDALVDHLQLPKEYKNIVHFYKLIANEYSSRHAGSSFSHVETEGFIYLTGVFIRLLIGK